MQRKPEEIRRPLSGKPYQTSPGQFFPVPNKQLKPFYQSRLIDNQQGFPLPFNQTSAIKISSTPVHILKQYNPLTKTSSHMKIFPNTKKVYFTFFHPDSLQIEKRFIQTIQYREQTQATNEWEQRYFDLQKQMMSFMQSHQKMTEQFIKIKQELKIHNQLSFQNTVDNFAKTQSLMSTHNQRQDNWDLIQKYDKLNTKFKQVQREAGIFKQQNIRMQIMIQKLQTQLISQKNLIYKIETEKNQYMLQLKQNQLNYKQLSNDKNKLQTQIYDLKLVLANKNLEIEQILFDKSTTQKNEANKSEKITKQLFQDRLVRIRTQYQKKQKKLQKIMQIHNKQISQLRKVILELQQRQKSSKQLKERYQKLYNQKKQQVFNLKKTQQYLLATNEDERQIVYFQHKIKQLTNIVKEQAQKIKQLQKTKKQMNKKIEQYQDNYVSQQQLSVLHNAIQKNKYQILQKGGLNYDELNNKLHPYFNGKIFQQKMIYQLKKDNLKLIEMVQKINMKQYIKQPQVVFNQHITINQQTGSNLGLNMQKMISDFYFKLQGIAEGVKYNTNIDSQKLIRLLSPEKNKMPYESPTKRSKKQHQKTQKQNNKIFKISKDLQILKVYIVDLSSTCDILVKKLQSQQKTRNTAYKQQQTVLSQISQIIPKDAQLIQFYKTKNKQLESRINQLLNLSNMLKQKLSQKHIQQNTGQQYWKNEIKNLQNECEKIRGRYDKLLSQYQQVQTKKQQYQSKIALYSMQIQRLNQYKIQHQEISTKIYAFQKQNEQLTRLKNNMERQLAISGHKCQDFYMKLQEYMRIIANKDKQIKQLYEKAQQIDRQNKSLQNNCRIYLSKNQEIQRNYNILLKEIQQLRKLEHFKQNYLELQKNYQNTSRKYQEQIEILKKNNKNISQQIQQIKGINQQLLYQNNKLKFQLTQMSSKTKQKQVILPSHVFYTIQMLRSRIIQCQILAAELSGQNYLRNQQIRNQLSQSFNQKLNLVSELSSIMNNCNSFSNVGQTQLQLEWKMKISDLQKRIKQNIHNNSYNLQFLRSLLIQLSTLLQELKLTQNSNNQIRQAIKAEINKGFQIISTFDLF